MDNIKTCNNYKTLGTYNSNILNSSINYNVIKEEFGGAFSISSAVRYPWSNRPCVQYPCSSCHCVQASESSSGGRDMVGI